MFATATAHRAPHAYANAYRQVGVQTGIESASPHQLVLMLLDGFQDALAQARCAITAGHIEAKGQAIGRAVRILEEGLRANLNLQSGGKIAEDLNHLYTYLAVRLTLANASNDAAILEECTNLMQPVRSAWAAIGGQAGAVTR